MRVAIIGQGYVGLTIAVDAAVAGHTVVGVDVNGELVKKLNLGQSHIEGITNSYLGSLLESGRYSATSNPSALEGCEVIVIAVPTPLDGQRNPDLSFVHAAADLIAENVQSPSLVVNESTPYGGKLLHALQVLNIYMHHRPNV